MAILSIIFQTSYQTNLKLWPMIIQKTVLVLYIPITVNSIDYYRITKKHLCFTGKIIAMELQIMKQQQRNKSCTPLSWRQRKQKKNQIWNKIQSVDDAANELLNLTIYFICNMRKYLCTFLRIPQKIFCKRSPLKFEENWFLLRQRLQRIISYIVALDTFAI